MLLTAVLSLVMMASLFLMLYAAVALVQDKRLFTSAPKDIQAAVQPKAERFPGAHVLGWCLLAFAVFLFTGAIVCGGWDGVRNDFSFRRFFFRFLFMLVSLKAFDVLFFDWFLLCRSQFFPHYYPEVSGLVGPHQFGFNWRSHLLHLLAFPLVSAGLAWICTLFF